MDWCAVNAWEASADLNSANGLFNGERTHTHNHIATKDPSASACNVGVVHSHIFLFFDVSQADSGIYQAVFKRERTP